MLRKLVLEGIVIFEHLEVEFGPHLNAITGEPGSGKSILLEGLKLCCGCKFDPRLLMVGKREGRVTLYLTSRYDGSNLHACALPGEWEISRNLYASGQTKALLNGQPITLKTLKTLVEPLLHLYLQNSQQSWFEDRVALRFLDLIGDYPKALERMSVAYQAVLATQQKLYELSECIQQQEHDRELRIHYLQELDELAIKPQEVDELQSIVKRYSQLEEIQRLCQKGYALCASSCYKSHGNLDSLLHSLNSILTALSELDQEVWKGRLQCLESFQEELHAFPRYFSEYIEQFEKPNLGAAAEERLSQIFKLARKHRCEPENLWTLHQDLRHKEENLQSSYAQKLHLEEALIGDRQTAEAIAQQLTRFRRKIADQLGPRITELLKQMSLPHHGFIIKLDSCFSRLNHEGCDRVTLQLQSSPEQKPLAIQKVASGGELSRIALSLAYCIAMHRPPHALFFDEIDAGLSGQAAVALGKILRKLGTHTQVITITHLPQVVATADHQLHLQRPSSTSNQKIPRLQLTPLSQKERVKKLAQLLSSGTNLSVSALRNAEDLLLTLGPTPPLNSRDET